jgi:hypothetical protein
METAGVLKPQARYGLDPRARAARCIPAVRLEARPAPRISPAEILIDVECLNLRENPAIRAIFERRHGVAG